MIITTTRMKKPRITSIDISGEHFYFPDWKGGVPISEANNVDDALQAIFLGLTDEDIEPATGPTGRKE